MYKLPPAAGAAPTKVVFEGVEPGSPEAQRLLAQNQPTIAHFHAKARQARDLSEQPGASMIQQLPDGGRLRYVYNGGQEAIFVRLNPRDVPQPQPRQPVELKSNNPVLAVDVLFDPEQFEVGTIYSTEPGTEHIPGKPAEEIVVLEGYEYAYSIDASNYGRNAEDYEETIVTRTFASTAGNSSYYFYSSLGDAQAGLDAFIAESEAETAADQEYYASLGYYGYISTSTITVRIAGYTFYQLPVPGFPGYSEYRAYFETLSVSTKTTPLLRLEPAVPDRDEPITRNFLEKRTYLNVLPVVGVRVDGARPYEALSTEPSQDARLRSLLGDERTTVSRQIAFDDPSGGERFYGAGFCATPRDPAMPGMAPAKFDIEVWIGAADVRQFNDSPGAQGDTWGVDSSDMHYEPFTLVEFTIRVREFSDGAYHTIKAAVDAQGKIERYKAPGNGTGSPTELVSTEKPGDARHVDWWFAANTGWSDGGQEPAQPERRTSDGAIMMGNLLDEAAARADVAKAQVPERTVPDKPTHDGEVQQLTKVAVIHWTPAAFIGDKGTAEIELLVPGGGGGADA